MLTFSVAGPSDVLGEGRFHPRSHKPRAAVNCNRRNREFFLAFMRFIQGAPKAYRLLKCLCRIAAVTLRRSIIRSQSMTWTCPEITEICVGMEITSYELAEV